MNSGISTASSLMLISIVIIAAAADIKSRRIPNKLIIAGIILSFISQILIEKNGIINWSSGLLTGFAIFFPFYYFRLMGAGDVKLVAVVSAFVGAGAAIQVILFTLAAGGVLAIATAIHQGTLRKNLENVRSILTHTVVNSTQTESLKIEALDLATSKMPYGAAIAIGTMTYLMLDFSGYIS